MWWRASAPIATRYYTLAYVVAMSQISEGISRALNETSRDTFYVKLILGNEPTNGAYSATSCTAWANLCVRSILLADLITNSTNSISFSLMTGIRFVKFYDQRRFAFVTWMIPSTHCLPEHCVQKVLRQVACSRTHRMRGLDLSELLGTNACLNRYAVLLVRTILSCKQQLQTVICHRPRKK